MYVWWWCRRRRRTLGLNKKCIRGGRYSLFFSHFSITVVLLFSLFPVVYLYRFLFFSLLFYLSLLFIQLMFAQIKTVHTMVYTFLRRVERSFFSFFLSMQAKTAACRVQWLVVIWQLHLMKKRTERKTEERKKICLSLCFFFLL
jgi:hypothetical protein